MLLRGGRFWSPPFRDELFGVAHRWRWGLLRLLPGEPAGAARGDGVPVAVGRAIPSGAGRPYRPLTEALQQALRDRAVPDDADLAPWLRALRAVMATIGGDGLGDDSAAVRGEAVLRLLRRLARPDGMVVVLEDLHWADADTLEIVEYLADNFPDEPVLGVVTCRSEPASAALDLLERPRARRGATGLSLGRLSDDHVEQMVRSCLPGASNDAVARVRRAAEGVPFVVEEMLASPGLPSSFADR